MFPERAAEAKKALPLKTGWYPVAWLPDFYNTLIPHVSSVRQVGALLQDLAILHSHDGKHEEATGCQ